MNEIERLQQIGLNKYEAEAYYTLLSQGPLTGYELGKRSPVPLSRSYEVLERLTQKGLALIQPGDPPRYAAADPRVFLGRVRNQMEETLTALAETLTALPQVDIAGQFWVIRQRQYILERARSMIEQAQHTLDLHLPGQTLPEFVQIQTLAQSRSQQLAHTRLITTETRGLLILLLVDSREALAGMLMPAEQCQAVVSDNPAFITLLRSYFSNAYPTEKSAQAIPAQSAGPSEHLDWLAWEERKQRRLWRVNARNHVA
jgi:sugar-specific transcriptional regulator TrmB